MTHGSSAQWSSYERAGERRPRAGEDRLDAIEEPVGVPGRRRTVRGAGERVATGARARERQQQRRRTVGPSGTESSQHTSKLCQSVYATPLKPSRAHVFSATSTWIFAFVPIPIVSMTRSFAALNPARLRSTSRSIVNGSASTT